jgi:hypothetical protein
MDDDYIEFREDNSDYEIGVDDSDEDDLYENNKTDIERVDNDQIPEEFKEPDVLPELKYRTYVSYPYLKELRDSDFDIKSRSLIDFVSKDEDINNLNIGAWFVLFHDESTISQKYLKTWVELARVVRNDRCYLGHCNLTFEKKIYNNFLKLNNREYFNHPFSWAKYRESPFIMVYRDSWPQGFYNGTIYLEELVDYCIEEVANDTREISKEYVRRRDIRDEILSRDKTILRQLALDRSRARKKKERAIEKNIDPSQQKISRAIDFLQ